MRIMMTRERVVHSYENQIDPNEPEKFISEVFENEDSHGWWNEFYRILIVPDDWDGSYAQLEEEGEVYGFTNYTDAKAMYRELLKTGRYKE